MKTRKTNNLKIALATVICIFTLATTFTGTLAWFSSNRSVEATGLSVTVKKGSSIKLLSCYAIRYDGNYGALATNVMNGGASIAMSEYDYIFRDRNVNTPMFLRMGITNFDTSNDLTVTIPCTGGYKTDNKVEPYLSNVVSAKFMCGIKSGNTVSVDNNTWTGDDVTTSAVVASYQGMLENAHDVIGTPYVTGNTKQNSITLTLPAATAFDPDFIIQRQDGNQNNIDVIVAYIAFDYHVTGNINLVSSYLDSYGLTDHSLTFNSDVHNVTIENGGH